MATYLLTWKPKRWDWDDLEEEIRELRTAGHLSIRWSAGVNRHIQAGDRVFLLRQGQDRPGIIAAGHVTRGSYLGKHWDPARPGERAIFVRLRLDSLLHPEQERILRRDELDFGPNRLWSSQSSGVTIPPDAAAELERRWSAHLKKSRSAPLPLAEEVTDPAAFAEGAKETVTINRYERDRRNRSACIAVYGRTCSACGFDFARVYGELGRNYIHVHHLVGLATSKGRQRRIDPRRDLRPVCPNCHAMLHVGGNNRTIEELRRVIRRNKRR